MTMKKFKNPTRIIGDYLVRKDEWIFIGLILTFSLIYTQSDLWGEYLGFVARYSLELLPILLYKFYQTAINAKLSKLQSIFVWLLFFAVYPIAILLYDFEMTEVDLFQSSRGDILFTFVLVELALIFNKSFKSIELLKVGLSQFGLDKVILLFLTGFAIYFGLLVTSDLALWNERNAVGHPIRWMVILDNLPTFLSMTGQMLLLYLMGFLFYWVNRHILIKKLLAERGTLIYFLGVGATVVFLYPILTEIFLFMPINGMSQPIIPAEEANAFKWDNGAVASVIMLLSLPVILIINSHKKNNQLIELEKEKTSTELQLLKQQINPHFFFNTLNNLYALCLKKSEQAPEVVLQLSELMRYVVYQAQQDFVSIKDEVKYIEDYINLQSIRLNKKLTLDIEMDVTDSELKIAPLLLIILVENAFKHGIEPATEASFLTIRLTIEDKKIIFQCHNSIESSKVDSDESNKKINDGLGLSNLKRRLSLLYPDKHQLALKQKADSFEASIILNSES